MVVVVVQEPPRFGFLLHLEAMNVGLIIGHDSLII